MNITIIGDDLVMIKSVNLQERENQILDLIIETYINDPKPVSSTYLCQRYRLPYSSATVRSVMVELEKKELLAHVYTSSGRVPTKTGFRHYVERLKSRHLRVGKPVDMHFDSTGQDIDWIITNALDNLARISGYTSLMAIDGKNKKIRLRGERYILEQPEFKDTVRLKNFFYALEEKVIEIQQLLCSHFDDEVSILIGDEIGFKEISDCALIISGTREKKMNFSMAVIGPMRMNYAKASSSLSAVKQQLKKIIEKHDYSD